MSSDDSASDISQEEIFPYGIKVLVIDDDQVTLQIVCSTLEQCGYVVTKCTRGKEGLELLKKNQGEFDIVLTDVHMPDMDGLQLIEQIGLEMDMPVVLMSQDSSRKTMMKGLVHGACDFLVKPVKKEQLEKIGEHVLIWRRANELDRESTDDDDEEGEDGGVDDG